MKKVFIGIFAGIVIELVLIFALALIPFDGWVNANALGIVIIVPVVVCIIAMTILYSQKK